MPTKSGRRKGRNSGQLLATSLGPPRGFPASSDEDDGTCDAAADDDEVSESDIREAASREGPTSPPRWSADDVARLHAKIELLEGRLETARFDQGGGNAAHKCPTWKYGSFRAPPSDTLQWTSPGLCFLCVAQCLTGLERTPSCSGSPKRSGSCWTKPSWPSPR
jgi:hypothetical protein